MFLGTPRRWWLAAALLFIAALLLIGTDTGGTLGDIVGILLLFASIGVFGMSPMRYRPAFPGIHDGRCEPACPDRSASYEPATAAATRDRCSRSLGCLAVRTQLENDPLR